MIKNRLKHKAAGILAAFLITVSMAGAVWADPLPEETTPPEETTASEPAETIPEETQPVEPQETVIPEETGEPTEYGFGLTPTGNMALQDDISGEEAEAQSIEFLTVTTRDNHTFYIVIEHTKNGDNVHFLNQVDDADLRAVLSDEQVAEYFPDEAGTEPTESSGFSLLGGDDKDPETEPEDGTDKESKGGSSITMLLVVVGLVAVVAGGYYFLKIKPKKDGKINEDAEFDDDEECETEDIPDEDEDEESDEIEGESEECSNEESDDEE